MAEAGAPRRRAPWPGPGMMIARCPALGPAWPGGPPAPPAAATPTAAQSRSAAGPPASWPRRLHSLRIFWGLAPALALLRLNPGNAPPGRLNGMGRRRAAGRHGS